MPRIYITEPNHVFTFELPVVPGAEVLIGAAPHCQLSLPGVGGLAEVHARIVCQPQGYVIEDFGTPYGTLANGRPVQAEYLMPGVEYRLGAAIIAFDPAGAQPQPAAAPTQPAAAAPAKKKPAAAKIATAAAKKPAAGLKTAAAAGVAPKKVGGGDLSKLAEQYNRKSADSSKVKLVYVVIVLIAALYAGIALHHWERTGNFLPGIVADGE